MTRATAFIVGIGLATTAEAHPSHITAAGGHDHWTLLVGLVLIAGAALPLITRAVRRRR